MAWIQLRFHRTTVSVGEPLATGYRVEATIDAAYGVPVELFVYETETGVYAYAAGLDDLVNLPATRGVAQSGALPTDFYRARSAVMTFDRPAGVEEFVGYVKTTLKQTVARWARHTTTAVGSDDVVVYDSDNP